ncbi:MgtC/SapB family protein [Nitrosophilus alvini]|uniref:MgtC/SapB family protein n=1 Tax=Nitrosophilus alvini TaxID=2714855 RepID=UPI001F2E913E|nr:MgtC/SapB family protein [Nitrosophilus alvini]
MVLEYSIIKSLLIALVLGFVIGMQRTLAHMQQNRIPFAGSRTFALICLLGYLSGWMQEYIENIVPLAISILGVLIAISYYIKAAIGGKKGITTQIAALITYFLGLMIYYDLENYAVFLGVLIVILLDIKPRLQRFESHLTAADINAAILLMAMSFVVLPVLPDRMMGPYNLFNPYKTWLMAVIIAAISFVGYAAIKILGNKRGVFLTGAFGGLISSTAVSITLSKLYNFQKEYISNYAGGIAIACTFMYLRVLFEAAVIYPGLAEKLVPAFAGAALAGFGFSYYFYRFSRTAEISFENSAIMKNPLQLSEAIKFGILFGLIYGAIAFVKTKYGDVGVYVVSFFSGITDVDAITLSLSELSREQKLHLSVSMNGIVIASVTNSIVKLGIVYWLGGRHLGWRLTQFFVVTLGIMGIGVWVSENFFV